ncbi:MAG: exo-alpha-sialidase, partial [Pirellulales bacterium]
MRIMSVSLVALVATCAGRIALAGPHDNSAREIRVTQVIGAEFPGKYKHPASFDQLDNGDLLLAYYGGGGEYEDDSKVWAMRLKTGGSEWTTPKVVADTPFRAEGNPVVWQGPHGVVWLFYVQRHVRVYHEPGRYGGWPANYGIWNWGDEILVGFQQGYYKDRGEMHHHIDMDKPRIERFARSHDGGATWALEEPEVQPTRSDGSPIDFRH